MEWKRNAVRSEATLAAVSSPSTCMGDHASLRGDLLALSRSRGCTRVRNGARTASQATPRSVRYVRGAGSVSHVNPAIESYNRFLMISKRGYVSSRMVSLSLPPDGIDVSAFLGKARGDDALSNAYISEPCSSLLPKPSIDFQLLLPALDF